MKWKLNECRKNVYENYFHNTVSKPGRFYRVIVSDMQMYLRNKHVFLQFSIRKIGSVGTNQLRDIDRIQW